MRILIATKRSIIPYKRVLRILISISNPSFGSTIFIHYNNKMAKPNVVSRLSNRSASSNRIKIDLPIFFFFFNHLTFEENILLRLNLLVFPIEELMVTLLLVQVSIEILGSSFIYLIYCRYIKSSPTYKNILEKNFIRSYYQIDS